MPKTKLERLLDQFIGIVEAMGFDDEESATLLRERTEALIADSKKWGGLGMVPPNRLEAHLDAITEAGKIGARSRPRRIEPPLLDPLVLLRAKMELIIEAEIQAPEVLLEAAAVVEKMSLAIALMESGQPFRGEAQRTLFAEMQSVTSKFKRHWK